MLFARFRGLFRLFSMYSSRNHIYDYTHKMTTNQKLDDLDL